MLATYSYDLMFCGYAATSLGFAVLALTCPAFRSQMRGPSWRCRAAEQLLLAVLKDTRYLLFMLALFLNAVVYIQSTSVLSLQVTMSGGAPVFYAALLSLNALVVTCLELPYTKFVQRLPPRLAVALGIGLVGVGMNLYLAGPLIAMFVLATLVWTVGEMTGTPTASAYPGRVAPPGLRPRYFASAAFSMQIGYAVGPAIGTAVWAVWPSGVWWLCGFLTVMAVVATLTGMARPATRNRTRSQPGRQRCRLWRSRHPRTRARIGHADRRTRATGNRSALPATRGRPGRRLRRTRR